MDGMSATRDLLRLLRHDWDRSSWTAAAFEHHVDWTEVVRIALDHGVGGLLCRSIGALPAGAAPEDIVGAAGAYLETLDHEGASRVARLAEILDALAADDIPALPFKGPALGILAHASATIRPSRDIDVLVHAHDMVRATNALGRLGYRTETLPAKAMAACYKSYGQDILFAEDRPPVEPHCAFLPGTLAVDLDIDGFWRRARAIDIEGHLARTLSIEDTVLVACLHGSKERWWRLLWVADVAALIHRHPELDWSALSCRACVAGVQRMLRLGILLARDLFGCTVPPTVSSSIDRDDVLSHLAHAVERDLFQAGVHRGPPERVSRYYWQMRERSRDRLRYVWRTLTAPRFHHYGMIRLPDPLFGGYVVVKLVHDYVLLPLWWLVKGRWRRRAT
jgi:hypothetical protein